MIPSISNSLSAVSSSMSTVGNHVADSLKPKNLLRVALAVAPVLTAFQMISSVPGADGGFVCFAVCMGVCLGASSGAFVPMCTATCIKFCANPITP